MSTGAWIVVAAVVIGLGFGLYRMLTDGRFRGTHQVRDAERPPVEEGRQAGRPVVEEGRQAGRPVVEVRGAPAPSLETTWTHVQAAIPDAELGDRAMLLQFSSAFCAPCRATRRTLSEVAAVVPGVEHLEVDAEHHLDLVRRLGILRTPTTLVLDASGREVNRAAGAPRKEQVLAALANA